MTSSAFQETALQCFLEKVVRDEGFQRPKFQIEYGSKPGDNFVGRIYRVVISESGSSKNLSLIFKATPLSKHRREMLSTDDTFQVELGMYQTVLPTFNKLLNKYGVTNSNVYPGTARYFASYVNTSQADDANVLVLEDKSHKGFRMFSGRGKILDVEHCRITLKKIAMWHATSMALYHHDPETAKKLEKLLTKEGVPLNNENHPLFNEIIPGAFQTLRDTYKYCQIDDSAYQKTQELLRNFKSHLITISKPSPDLFCIIHGDCWTNNVLFKYDKEGRLEDACVLDFTLARVASPVIDLAGLLFLCTSKELREAHYDELLQIYHDELRSTLTRLDCDADSTIPWQRLQEHLKRSGKIGVLAGLAFLLIMGADSSDFQIDVHISQKEGNVLIDSAKVADPKTRGEILRRIADVIEDSYRLGYI